MSVDHLLFFGGQSYVIVDSFCFYFPLVRSEKYLRILIIRGNCLHLSIGGFISVLYLWMTTGLGLSYTFKYMCEGSGNL